MSCHESEDINTVQNNLFCVTLSNNNIIYIYIYIESPIPIHIKYEFSGLYTQ